MDFLRFLTILLDILLVIVAVFAFYYRPRIGGQLAMGLRLLLIGVILLGLTHMTDTLINTLIDIHRPLNSVFHRGLNLAGFVFIFIGFFRMRQALEA